MSPSSPSSSLSLTNRLCLDKVDVAGKQVLMRVDFNVPMDDDGERIQDDQRIVAALPSIRYCIQHGATRLVLMSHLGRPNGHPDPRYSLRPIAAHLQQLLDQPVQFVVNLDDIGTIIFTY